MEYSQIDIKTPIPELLDEAGRMRLLSAAELDAIERRSLRMFCHIHGRYGLPTVELIAWLKAFIGDRKAIEIGAGAGDLAYHLGIPATDSWLQTRPDIAQYYAMTGQPIIRYPNFVEKLEAIEAVRKHRPQVVIGCWVTHWVSPNKTPENGVGNMFGIKEHLILDRGITYVMIGCEHVHRFKPIMQRQHETLALPFLRSRSVQGDDRIYVWGR